MVVRTLRRRATIAGRDLPAGTTVAPSILLTHSDPASFPDPEAFRPERFTGAHPPALNTWIPFGGGARRCLGAAFSQMEAVEVLREVFASYDVTAVGVERPQVRNITSVPDGGARIVVAERVAS
jgi:cytochrome P450